MKPRLHVKLSGREKEYYDQGMRELKAGRANEALTSFNSCKTIFRGSFMALDECIVKACTELGKESYLKTKNSAWFVTASDASIQMCKDYGKDSYKPWVRRAKVLEAGKLYDQSLLVLELALGHTTYTSAPSAARNPVEAMEKKLRGHIRHRRLLVVADPELAQLAKDLHAEMVYKTTTNFIKSLPAQVLLCIADAGLEMEQGFALRMAGVCKEWRAVVNSQAGLWDTLILGSHKPSQKAKLWIDRSGGRLRELRFNIHFPQEKMSAVVPIIKPSFSELESLYVGNPRSSGNSPDWTRCFHKLRTLELSHGSVQDLDNLMMAQYCRTLQKVTIEGAFYVAVEGYPNPQTMAALPSGFMDQFDELRSLRITTSTFKPISLNRFERFVIRLQRLQHLQLQQVWEREDFLQLPAPLSDDEHESHLDELEHYEISRGTGPLLECRMPKLSTFDCYGTNHPASKLFPYIATYIQPFSTSLTSLDMGLISLRDDELVPLLESLPTLRFLGISNLGLDDKFLAQLNSADEDGRVLLPNLEAISLARNELTTLGVRDFVMKRVPLSEWVAATPAPAPPRAKVGGAFRPAKISKTGGGMFKPSTSTKPSLSIRQNSGLISGRASRPTPNIACAPLLPPPSEFDSLSQPNSISPSTIQATNSPSSVAATQGSQKPADQTIARIQWINLDACQFVDPSLKDHLVKFVRFVSVDHGPINEDRVRAKGVWSWKGDWKETCKNATKCRLVPAPHKKEEWEVRHYCVPDIAEEALKIPSFSQVPRSI